MASYFPKDVMYSAHALMEAASVQMIMQVTTYNAILCVTTILHTVVVK